MPVLAEIFSAGNTLKRRLRDFATDPVTYFETGIANLNERAGEFNTLHKLATQGEINKLRGQPITPEQQAAELKVRDIVAGAYNPIGMTVKNLLGAPKVSNLQEFQELASKGQMRMAKSRKQEIEDLKSGKSKFAELNLNWDDPDTYDFIDPLKNQGFKVTTQWVGPDFVTYLSRSKEDVRPILEAKNPAQWGKAYGYSDADIARFYTERFRGYPVEEVYRMYLRDMGTPKQMTKKIVNPNQPVKTYQSTDGYTFYEMPNGKIVDNLNPENVDMSWGSKKEFLNDMEGTVAEIGDVLGQRRANLASYNQPNQESLLKHISQDVENDPITQFYRARKKQIESQERKAKLSLVKDDFESDPLMKFLDPDR